MGRPFRQLIGALFNSNGALVADAREIFNDAKELYDSGRYADAAERFAHLAALSQNFGRPRRTVQLRMHAYEAWLKAKQPSNALLHVRTAIAMVLGAGRPKVALQMARQIVEDLQMAGYKTEAATFAKEVNERLAAHGLSLATKAPAGAPAKTAPQPKQLPTTCPQCGGRLPRAYEENEVECDYCGSIVRAE
jgi:hypothetical protein